MLQRERANQLDVGVRVLREAVDGHDGIDPEAPHDPDVPLEVRGASGQVAVAVVAQRAQRRDDDDCARMESGPPADEVHMLFEAHVGPESALGDHEIGGAKGEQVGDERVVPVSDVREGPAWTIAGTPSSVWIRFGFSASFRRTAIAPAAPRSSAVTGAPSRSDDPDPPERTRSSERSPAVARIPIVSEAAVMSKPVLVEATLGRKARGR